MIDHSRSRDGRCSTGLIMDEIQRFDQIPSREGDVRHDIRWLSAGQTFEL